MSGWLGAGRRGSVDDLEWETMVIRLRNFMKTCAARKAAMNLCRIPLAQ